MKARRPNWNRDTGGASGFTEVTHDLRPFFNAPHGLNAIPLGINTPGGNTGAYWQTQLHQGHGLCLAPNSGGKGASVLIPALLTYSGSVLGVDVKGEAEFCTAPMRRAMGQRVINLDPWHEVNKYGGGRAIEPTTRFNPLGFIRAGSRTFNDDVAALADALIISTPGENPHWPDSARQFVAGLIALVKEKYGNKATLKQVRKLMSADVPLLIQRIADVRRLYPDSLAASKLKRFAEATTSDEIKSVRSTAITQTDFLDSPDLADALEDDTPPFNLDEFATRPTTIYVVLPPDKLITHGRWLRMILALTMRAITRAPRVPTVPALMLIDEMGTIGPLRPLEAGYGLLRGYGVRFFGFLQSLGQLKADYPSTWQNFFGNCSIVQVLGARDMETASYISELLGTTTLHKTPGETALDWIRDVNSGNPGASMGGNNSKGSRPVMYPHELAMLLGHDPSHLEACTQLLMFRQGGHNALMLQNPYFREKRWAGMYRNPPQFTRRPTPANDNRWSFFKKAAGM